MRDAFQQGDLAALWERALVLGEQPLELSLVRPHPNPCTPGCLLARSLMLSIQPISSAWCDLISNPTPQTARLRAHAGPLALKLRLVRLGCHIY